MYIPSLTIFETRFSFIKNDILRINIAIAFRYVFFLLDLTEDKSSTLPGSIIYSLYKDIILYTATIIESCIHYCLKEYVDKGKVKSADIMPEEWKEKDIKELYSISETEKICAITKKLGHQRFSHQTQFIVINRAALKAKIFDRELFEKAKKLRQKRNHIHLAALKEVDDYYEKKDVQEAFDDAKEIIQQIERKLLELEK